MLKMYNFLSVPIFAAAAAGLLGIGMMNQILAQDQDNDSAPPAAPQNADEQTPDAQPSPADDAAPPRADDLNFDEQGRADEIEPPAVPDDRGDVGEDGRISPSDRTLNGRSDRVQRQGRSEVRRFDYDDPSQPIPEDHARARYGQGCHPCATQRVYYHPCGGWGQGYGYGGWQYGGSGQYQTQWHDPNRAVIGVTIDDREDGVQILSVAPDSPAAEAGLEAGDQIVAINGRDVRHSQTLMSQMRGMRSGEQVSLTIDRDGERQNVDAHLSQFAQVFGDRRGEAGSSVPTAPDDRFAQRGEPRTVFRPQYEQADSAGERLKRVQMRIDQLERELAALRKEEQSLQDIGTQEGAQGDDAAADDVTPPAELPTPAQDEAPDAGDALKDEGDGDAATPKNEGDPDAEEGAGIDADSTEGDASDRPEDGEQPSPR